LVVGSWQLLIGGGSHRLVGRMLKVRDYSALIIVALAAVTAACDKAQLLAPTQSTITLSAPTRILPSNGTTSITAAVLEQAGTPVQNGTTVRFTTTLGSIDPVEVQTTNGIAVTTFFAGANSGIAEIRANSGAASGGDGTTATNLLSITIGAAAVETVTVRANPSSVGPNGGTVELIATVVGLNGQPVEGVLVNFNADQGSLGSTTAVTNSNGEARTTLTTSQQTIVTANAGTKTSANLTISSRVGPVVTITCTPASGTPVPTTCAAMQASSSSNTATVLFTVEKPATANALRAATIDFGDGTSQSLGNLSTGTTTVSHTYEGPSAPGTRSYTATVVATDVNGESASTSTTVIVNRPFQSPINVNLTAVVDPLNPRRWTFTATALEGTATPSVQSYTWDFGDDTEEVTTSGSITSHVYTAQGIMEVTVTVRTVDGRTGVGRTEIRVVP
jgi:adhesin/invasin